MINHNAMRTSVHVFLDSKMAATIDNKDLFVPKNKIFTFFELYEKKILRKLRKVPEK